MEPIRDTSQLQQSTTQHNLDTHSFKDDTTFNSKTQNTDNRPQPDASLPLQFNEISLESSEVDLEALKQVDGYSEVRYKDAIYLGTIITGKRHGKGVMKYPNNRQYEGFWVQDLRDGKGFERYPNGNTYFG